MSAELTFQLGGEVTLDDLSEGARRFKDIVEELSRSNGHTIQWVVTNLEVGSALITVTGEAEDSAFVEEVAHEYTDVASRWNRGERIENPKLSSSLQALNRLLGDHIVSIRFSTEEQDVQITDSVEVTEETPSTESYDLLEGQVSTITDRGGLKFTMYESVYGVGVTCYLNPGQEETMRGLWGHRAIVEGLVRRDADTGRPRQVRDILLMERADDRKENPYSFLDARGIFPWKPGEPPPEELVRKMRDAR